MKRKKISAFITLIALTLTMMTGCMMSKSTVIVNADGSGTVTVWSGSSENYLLESTGMSRSEIQIQMKSEGYEKKEVDGKTYWGTENKKNFSNLSELDFTFEENVMDENGNSIGTTTTNYDFGDVKMGKTTVGMSLTIHINLSGDVLEDITATEGSNNTEIDALDSRIEALMEKYKDDFIVQLMFQMPGTVTETKNTSKGVHVSGNIIKINYVEIWNEMQRNGDTETTLMFQISNIGSTDTTIAPHPALPVTPSFIDVQSSDWYYEPIEVLYAGGLIKGYENGSFAPLSTISVAEYCEILANATGMETGTGESGWWAEKAIQGCIDAGYIAARGPVTAEVYNTPITREEAVAVLQKVSKHPVLEKVDFYVGFDIPDWDEISDQYKDFVLEAYNSGLTIGVDANRTFLPKKNLSRAEVCQLFYTIGWTTEKTP